ncbi:MAG: hypothetical protein QXK37_03980 [Candidatus Woesearchaeota archaeon]
MSRMHCETCPLCREGMLGNELFGFYCKQCNIIFSWSIIKGKGNKDS